MKEYEINYYEPICKETGPGVALTVQLNWQAANQ